MSGRRTCTHGRTCTSCTDCRRAYHRQWARAKQAQKYQQQLAGLRRCPHRFCGGLLDTTIGENGRTVTYCPLCERRLRGICRDCPAPVAGQRRKALRCAQHKAAAKRRQIQASAERHKEERRARSREYYQNNAERRARRLEYKRLYRQANRDQVKKEKYRAGVRDGKARERHLRYHRRYNAKKARQQKKRALALLTYYEQHPDRPIARCTACGGYLNWAPARHHGRPPRWCDKHAPASEKSRRKKLGRSFVVVPEPPPPQYVPLKIVERARRARDARTCLTPGCTTPVSGRTKKCEPCKAVLAAKARLALAEHRGRGSRTDLAGRQGAA